MYQKKTSLQSLMYFGPKTKSVSEKKIIANFNVFWAELSVSFSAQLLVLHNFEINSLSIHKNKGARQASSLWHLENP